MDVTDRVVVALYQVEAGSGEVSAIANGTQSFGFGFLPVAVTLVRRRPMASITLRASQRGQAGPKYYLVAFGEPSHA